MKMVIRRYELYASRTRGKWSEYPEIIRHAPAGWKAAHQENAEYEEILEEQECEVSEKAFRKAWTRLLTKVAEIDPPGVDYSSFI